MKDIAVQQWLDSLKSERTRVEYEDRFTIWLEYCKAKGLPLSGSEQIEDIKKRRLSNDNTVKYFYDNEIPKFFQWLQKEYRGKRTNKPLSESSALTVTTAIRSFFSFHRYSLEIQKEALPSSEKVESVFKDHAFDIYQLRAMYQHGDLKERTILECGSNLWLRASDFLRLKRETIEYLIKAEKEKAQNEARETDIIEFEIVTQKEKEPCSCHLSKEAIELLEEYLKTYEPKSEFLFDLTEEALSDLLRRLADRSQITIEPNTRIRWHCLRKFGITLMHGKVTEPVFKYMVGKHIAKDLRVYIQNNRETYKAFKLIEPLISLTKSNGNGATKELAKQLEDLKKATMKQLAILKLMEKLTPKEELRKAILELASEFGIKLEVKTEDTEQLGRVVGIPKVEIPDLDTFITQLSEAIAKKDLERLLAENGNNNHS